MSEIRINLIDSFSILSGTIHGSIGDQCVAALSAEPETIDELQQALCRFDKDPVSLRNALYLRSDVDANPHDAGILLIDLAARIVACDSTYSKPGSHGRIRYQDQQQTDPQIIYVLPKDWHFCDSVEEYEGFVSKRRAGRANPLDARAVLYGRPLLDFLATNIRLAVATNALSADNVEKYDFSPLSLVGLVHAQWLLTPREDLRGSSPRDILLAERDFIDAELETRALQWSWQLEGPPCLSRHSYAFRYAGIGSHEGFIYYGLVRCLLNETIYTTKPTDDFESVINRLEELKTIFLTEPDPELDGRTPGIIIDNERQRLPEAMGGRSMVVDEDCPICKAMGDECEAGRDVCFWSLDCDDLDDHFAFSSFATEQEYLEAKLNLELSRMKFDQELRKHEKKEPDQQLSKDNDLEPDQSFRAAS